MNTKEIAKTAPKTDTGSGAASSFGGSLIKLASAEEPKVLSPSLTRVGC